MTREESGIPAEEAVRMGAGIEGVVLDVFRWGVFVDLGLSHIGFIDPAYIDDGDVYEVGQVVAGHLSSYNEVSRQFWLRPLGQVPIGERPSAVRLENGKVVPRD